MPSVKCSLTWHIEELVAKYQEIFINLSDFEIPMELLSIGMELGEGATN